MPDQRYWIRDLLILTFLLSLLFGFQLGRRALWSPDEGRYAEIPREMLVTGNYVTPRLNGIKYFEKPPLFYWLQCLSIRLFGLSERALRLWTAIFALAGCLAVYSAGRKIFNRRTGLIAAIILASGPLYYGMGRIITLDMAVSVLLACALLAFLLATREPPGNRRRLAMWGFYLFSALATMTKGLIGFVIPAMVIGTWIVLLGEWRLLKSLFLPSGLALFLLIVAPWHILVAQANPEFLDFYLIHEHFQRYLAKHGTVFYWPWYFIPVLLLGLFPWTCFLFQAVKRAWVWPFNAQEEQKATLFLILWAGWVFVFFSGSSSKLIPYILPMFPPLALIIGAYFAEGWEMKEIAGFRVGCWAAVVVSVIIAAGGLLVSPYFLKDFSDRTAIAPYQYALYLILTLGPLGALFLSRIQGLRYAFYSIASTAILMLLIVNGAMPLLDQRRSVKGLALVIQPQLKPEDEVANYHTYYQDLPVYLRRRITIVGWTGELSFGSRVEDVSSWMIDDAVFWRQWNGPNTVYLLAPLNLYNQLYAESGQTMHLLAKTEWDVLLSNKTGQGNFPRK